MDDPPEDTPGIRNAIKRLSSVLSRKASTATTTLKRSKSTTFNSISNLPNKDAVPPRSALRGGRPSGTPDYRVSFYDSLPYLDYGPTLTDMVALSTESAGRRGGLLLPAITADDRSADDRVREVGCDNEQSITSPADLQPVDRHDSSVEPVSLSRARSARRPGISASLSSSAERRRSCVDFTKAMMEENARSQRRMRSMSLLSDTLLADKAARGQSPRPADRGPVDVAFSPEALPRRSSPRSQEHLSKTDHLGNVFHTYKAHVDRSLRSMQAFDERGSAYVNASLVEMQEALRQAMAENTANVEEDEADRAYAHTDASDRQSETDNSNASNEKADDAFSFDMPYDSAQPSAEAVNSTNTTELETSARLNDLGSYKLSDEDSIFDAALMPLPLRTRPHHPQRDSKVAR